MEHRLTYNGVECYVHKHTCYGEEVRPVDEELNWCVYLAEDEVKRLIAERKAEVV